MLAPGRRSGRRELACCSAACVGGQLFLVSPPPDCSWITWKGGSSHHDVMSDLGNRADSIVWQRARHRLRISTAQHESAIATANARGKVTACPNGAPDATSSIPQQSRSVHTVHSRERHIRHGKHGRGQRHGVNSANTPRRPASGRAARRPSRPRRPPKPWPRPVDSSVSVGCSRNTEAARNTIIPGPLDCSSTRLMTRRLTAHKR